MRTFKLMAMIKVKANSQEEAEEILEDLITDEGSVSPMVEVVSIDAVPTPNM